MNLYELAKSKYFFIFKIQGNVNSRSQFQANVLPLVPAGRRKRVKLWKDSNDNSIEQDDEEK